MVTIAGTGSPQSLKGLAIHTFACDKSMIRKTFYNSDGDLLIVPELAPLDIQTEFGRLYVTPGEVFLLPRGLKMTVTLPDGPSRGWIAELYEGRGFVLPNLGPLGSQGLADVRHFMVPTAEYEDAEGPFELVAKFGGSFFTARLDYSPYDVVGWSGRYHPSKYNLMHFMAFGSTTWDHADPSIHTVIHCPIDDKTNASACDFVCFRGRWEAVDHTFRPPYYHRNAATEFNAIVRLDTPYSGFDTGVHWLTPLHTAHGIAAESYNRYTQKDVTSTELPSRVSENSIWIMFESSYPLTLTAHAISSPQRDPNYPRPFFMGVKRKFTGPAAGAARW